MNISKEEEQEFEKLIEEHENTIMFMCQKNGDVIIMPENDITVRQAGQIWNNTLTILLSFTTNANKYEQLKETLIEYIKELKMEDLK